MKKTIFSFVFILFAALALPLSALAWPAKVFYVDDGDTIRCKDKAGQNFIIRIYGVDAPEKDQLFGDEARAYLEGLLKNKTVEVTPLGMDTYKRTVARVEIITPEGSLNVGEKLVAGGFAWVYPRYCTNAVCRDWFKEQDSARRNGLGLWGSGNDAGNAENKENPIPPWEYRKAMARGAEKP